ncbi:3-hydroxyisobutyryl-CoA hydrolase, mitochondrial [Sphaceloma murrayae]|uniref:3-hydroxyisobutyryl-CoA hydrolase, mitochondrial n=1 Tax=Sphaceloma murrayae TaxID=2082308 RepID=A0A2K1QJQ4_9PEZI|nr:3-hydroxyisobutyryl-CoA hydrolase, mitochondrial [Sphaceloma murrayae]
MAPEQSTVHETDPDKAIDLRLIHFNDVYHVAAGSKDPCGGISRFQTLCNYYRSDEKFKDQPELLTFFSGDAFNPSLESSVTKGSHMVHVLNNIGTDATCVGNHDLDFGIPQFHKLAKQCKFPWLLSNILDKDGKTILGDCPPTHLITSSNGIKIGLIGIAEQDWISTVNSLPPDLPFLPAAEVAVKYSKALRAQGADMVIALCHQREVNDNRLAAEVPEGTLDIILAGHDHHYRYSKINGCHVICSGSDFKQLSYIEVQRDPAGKGWLFDITRRDITKDITEDPPTVALMDKLFATFRAKLEKPIGYAAAPLDARFETIRKSESNYANFVADLVCKYYKGDCALVVGGTYRGDQVYTPGVIRIKDIMDCFPFEDPDVMISTPGSAIWAALEHGVSKYPALEGRFPQVSNITYTFDPSKPPGSRLLDVKIGETVLDHQKDYKLVTRAYTVSGGDGFDCLKLKEKGGPSTYLIDEENGHLTSTLLRQYFMSLKVLGKWKNWPTQLDDHWSKVNSDLHKSQPVRAPTARNSPVSARTPVIPGAPWGKGSANDAREPLSPTLPTREPKRLRTDEANPGPPVVLTNTKPAQDSTTAPFPAEAAGWDGSESDDSESDDEDIVPLSTEPEEREKQLMVARKVMRKWRRIAGIKGTPGLMDGLAEGEGCHWTQGICPKVEGRIRIIGVNA